MQIFLRVITLGSGRRYSSNTLIRNDKRVNLNHTINCKYKKIGFISIQAVMLEH